MFDFFLGGSGLPRYVNVYIVYVYNLHGWLIFFYGKRKYIYPYIECFGLGLILLSFCVRVGLLCLVFFQVSNGNKTLVTFYHTGWFIEILINHSRMSIYSK